MPPSSKQVDERTDGPRSSAHRHKRARTSESTSITLGPGLSSTERSAPGTDSAPGKPFSDEGRLQETGNSAQASKPVQVQKGSDRFKKFQGMLVRLFSSARTDELSVARVEEEANKIGAYSRSEIEAMLNELEFENKIMFRDDVVHQI